MAGDPMRVPECLHSRKLGVPVCPHCGNVLLAPVSSEFITENLVRHLWSCESCGHRFHSAVNPKQARQSTLRFHQEVGPICFRAAETSGGYQEAAILVKDGYTPDTIIVRSGRPVRLNFRREEIGCCSEKVVFAEFQKFAELPTGQTVPVELLPKEPGEFGFACPMGVFRGRLIVE